MNVHPNQLLTINEQQEIADLNNNFENELGLTEDEINAAIALVMMSRQPPTPATIELRQQIFGSPGYQDFKNFVSRSSTGYRSENLPAMMAISPIKEEEEEEDEIIDVTGYISDDNLPAMIAMSPIMEEEDEDILNIAGVFVPDIESVNKIRKNLLSEF